MAVTTEIAPNIYRVSIFAEWVNLQFNHFLVKDDEPLLHYYSWRRSIFYEWERDSGHRICNEHRIERSHP